MVNTILAKCIEIMKQWYNNYCFSKNETTDVFNSDMVLFFIKRAFKECNVPKKMIDQNIRIDYNKLKYLIILDKQLNGNFSRLKMIMVITILKKFFYSNF